MNNTHSSLSNSATTSHQITRLMNNDILILNLTSVHQYLIEDTDKLHHELLIADDEC